MNNKYDKFLNHCYNNNLDMIDEMKKEIKANIKEFNSNKQNINLCVDNIMNLIYAVRYEW